MYVVPAATATAWSKLTSCQPPALSFENVARARSVPSALQRLPTWVPVLPVPL